MTVRDYSREGPHDVGARSLPTMLHNGLFPSRNDLQCRPPAHADSAHETSATPEAMSTRGALAH